jgi:hypothetical protein
VKALWSMCIAVLRRFAPASLAINFLLFSDDSMVEEQITSFPFQIVVKSRRNGFRCVFGVCLACVWLVWRVCIVRLVCVWRAFCVRLV